MTIRFTIRKYWWSSLFLIPVFALWRIHPSSVSRIPICSLKRMTGLDCPGCGATRATHFLLNGDIASALQHNAAYVCLLPIVTLGVLYIVWQKRNTKLPALPIIPLLVILGILLAAFGIFRNLPGYEWLNPPPFQH